MDKTRKRVRSDQAGPSSPKKEKIVKAEGIERGGPGIDYQVQLLMLFARKAYEFRNQQEDYYFELGTERKDAGKFDDVNFRYKRDKNDEWNYILIQCKYTGKK